MRLLVRPLSIVGAVVVAAVALPTPPALADAGAAIVRQCLQTGSVSDTYTQQAYSEALNDLGADASEYTDCAQVIRQAQLAAAARSRGGGGGGGAAGGGAVPSTAFTPAERASANSLNSPHTGGAPVSVGGQIVHPGVVNADLASAVSTIPSPLLAVLAILAAAAVLALARLLRHRVGPGRTD